VRLPLYFELGENIERVIEAARAALGAPQRVKAADRAAGLGMVGHAAGIALHAVG
jgi:hypothetical protein